jgi:hypothetical protein
VNREEPITESSERDRYLLVGFNWNIYSLVSVFWSGVILVKSLGLTKPKGEMKVKVVKVTEQDEAKGNSGGGP